MTTIMKNLIENNKRKTSSLNGWYTITPEFAKYLLDLNVNNYRNLNNNRVRQFATDMIAGKWEKNGEPIIVNKDGYLGDGQHRLNAIVRSNTTIECYVIFDADKTSLYDTGSSRSINTRFKAEGKPINTLNVATGKALLNYGSGTENWGVGVVRSYIEDRIELLKKAEKIGATGGTSGKKAPCLTVIYCLLKTKEISEAELRAFFKIVNSLNIVGCTKDPSPALVLRKQINEMKGGGRAMQKILMEITYKAIRDFKFNNRRIRRYNDDICDAERLVKEVYEKENTEFNNVA